MLDLATGPFDRFRNDVATVGDRRCAEDKHHSASAGTQLFDRAGHLAGLMGTPDLLLETAIKGFDAPADHLGSLIEYGGLGVGEHGLDQTDVEPAEGRDSDQPALGGGEGGAVLDGFLRCREGDDLDRRHHLFGFHHFEGGNGGDGHGLVGGVDPIEGFAVDHGNATGVCVQIHPSGEGGADGDVFCARRGADSPGGLVLADIAGLEPGGEHAFDTGAPKNFNIFGGKNAPFLEHSPARTLAVGEDRPFSFANRDRAKLH